MFEIKVDKREDLPPSLQFSKIAEDLTREASALGFDLHALPNRPGTCDLRLEKIEEDGLVYSVTKVSPPNSRKVDE